MSLTIGAVKQINWSTSVQAVYSSSGALCHRMLYIKFTWTQRHIREVHGRKEFYQGLTQIPTPGHEDPMSCATAN